MSSPIATEGIGRSLSPDRAERTQAGDVPRTGTPKPPDDNPADRDGPLSGIRVLDVGTRISAPFCAGLLGELGADVIKVELPGGGDFMRTIGPFVDAGDDEAGYSLFWAVEGRGRR